MLKHTSNAIGGPMNGQLRNASNSSSSVIQQRISNNILRPQHPLNVSSFSTTSSIPPAMANTGGSCGERLSANGLLDLNSSSTCNAHQPVYITNSNAMTKVPPISPINARSPNAMGNHLHTYCNQNITSANNNNASHVLQSNSNNINNNNNNNNTNPQLSNSNINEPNYSNCNKMTGIIINQSKHGPAPQEALTSLGLLCLVSLLLAMLSLIFLLKISPNGREEAILRSPNDDFVVIYDITLALCALSLSLNLCCLLVCAIQFLFAVKLVRSTSVFDKENKYLEKSRISRTCAIGGFFISIPIFLTGIILYTFNQFHSTPAIITSILIGIGIVFCGMAMVHNVFIWQKEKTICYKSASESQKTCVSQISSSKSPIHFLSTNNLINFNAANSPVPQLHNTTMATTNLSPASFNAINNTSLANGTLIMRPSTATPPTPKPMSISNVCPLSNGGCETSRSVSPGIIPPLDVSNITTVSAHELSTLV